MAKAPTGKEVLISCGGKIQWVKLVTQRIQERFKYDQYNRASMDCHCVRCSSSIIVVHAFSPCSFHNIV